MSRTRNLLLALLLTSPLAACPDGGGDTLALDSGAETDAGGGDAVAADIGHDSVGADADVNVTAPPCYPEGPADFADHSVYCFADEADLVGFADEATVPLDIKFTMLAFEDSPIPETHFLEPAFYRLHDEWYWFRLLNGAAIPGYPVEPVGGPRYASVAEIYAAFAGQSEDLPLDLSFISGDRLYSKRFYTDSGFREGDSRFFTLGSLLFYPAEPARVVPEAFWAFELEYSDRASAAVIVKVFRTLERWLPSSVSADLRWLARSPYQEGVARELAEGGGPYSTRTLSYDDLVVNGEVVVYNPGITAGYVNVLSPDFSPSELSPRDIAVLARVPDDIPPVRAMASAVPQTPLAHVNLLAKARGTPNAYVAGLLQYGQLGDWQYKRQPVVFRAEEGAVRWLPFECVLVENSQGNSYCTYPDYQHFLALRPRPVRTITQVPDLEAAPYTVDLSAGGLAEMAALVPLIGGKSAGMSAFNDFPAMTTPDAPLALTIRGYHEHLAQIRPALEELLGGGSSTSSFRGDIRVRELVLEGEAHFRKGHAESPQDLAWLEGWLGSHTSGVMRQIVEQGGVVRMIRDAPLDPSFEAEVRAALDARFSHLSPLQGLRFRSSATAEDVAGFNGAGLYDSNTGFLDPTIQPRDKDKKKSLAWAIKKTWASYWGVPAFEERRAAGIDHLAGNMGVLVHPRFDDPFEDANGVLTFYLSRWGEGPRRHLIVNIQDGALSVTNPAGTTAQPEVDEVIIGDSGEAQIRRERPSSEVPAGQWILSEAELTTLATQVADLADAWLDERESGAAKALRSRSLVLDLEIKRMAAGWPQLASGEIRPGALIYKQVRVLDSAPLVSQELRDPWDEASHLDTYLPKDVATAAREIEVRRCSGPAFDIRLFQVLTDAGAAELFPFNQVPLTYRVRLDFFAPPEGWSWPTTSPWFLGHTSLTEVRRGEGGALTLVLAPQTAAFFDLDSLLLDPGAGTWTARRGEREASGVLDSCVTETPFTSPAAFLERLVEEADAAAQP